MDADGARRITSDIRGGVSAAADSLLSLVEQGLADLALWRQGDVAAIDRIEASFCAMLEACAFGDIVGQRLSQLDDALAQKSPASDPLLNGPAIAGAGIDQAAADLLMAAPVTRHRP
ncbi:MAG: hypothetical protein Q8L23_10820 [Caulobacter sp.]|nr:hypothetical protein [Caulobacter sp.]